MLALGRPVDIARELIVGTAEASQRPEADEQDEKGKCAGGQRQLLLDERLFMGLQPGLVLRRAKQRWTAHVVLRRPHSDAENL